MTLYILDSSVAAKWYLPAAHEPLAAEARQVLREYAAGTRRVLVPDLFWPEMGNILWKAVRQGRMTRPSCEEAIRELEKSGIPTASSLPLLQHAFGIAAAFDRTVYDALYLALAIASNALFLTADERLANALGSRFPIHWLGAL